MSESEERKLLRESREDGEAIALMAHEALEGKRDPLKTLADIAVRARDVQGREPPAVQDEPPEGLLHRIEAYGHVITFDPPLRVEQGRNYRMKVTLKGAAPRVGDEIEVAMGEDRQPVQKAALEVQLKARTGALQRIADVAMCRATAHLSATCPGCIARAGLAPDDRLGMPVIDLPEKATPEELRADSRALRGERRALIVDRGDWRKLIERLVGRLESASAVLDYEKLGRDGECQKDTDLIAEARAAITAKSGGGA